MTIDLDMWLILKTANLKELYYKFLPLLGNKAQSLEDSKEMLEAVEKYLEGDLIYLGSGSEGIAIQISPDKVLKVSLNSTVGYFASQLAKSDIEGKEFNVLIIKSGNLGRRYHWWILEKVEQLNSDDLNFCLIDIKRLLCDFDEERIDLIEKFKDIENFNLYRPNTWPVELKLFVKKITKSVFTRIRKNWDIKTNLNKDWLQNLIKTSSILFVLRGRSFDLRADNVGLGKDRNFVVFDH